MINKKIFFLLLLFTFFIIPKDTFAATSYQYVEYCEDCDLDYITKNILSNSIVDNLRKEQGTNDYLITYNGNISSTSMYYSGIGVSGVKYIFTIPYYNYQSVLYTTLSSNSLQIYLGNTPYILLDEEFNVIQKNSNNVNTGYLYIMFNRYNTSNFYNTIISYNGFEIAISKDSDFYEGDTLLYNLIGTDYISPLKLREIIYNVKNPPPTYEINTIDYISHQILGNDIPQEYNFLYLIVDYLICLLFILTISSPFIICALLIRGFW